MFDEKYGKYSEKYKKMYIFEEFFKRFERNQKYKFAKNSATSRVKNIKHNFPKKSKLQFSDDIYFKIGIKFQIYKQRNNIN